MNTFKKKTLLSALAGVSVLGAVGSANAVYIDEAGVAAQVLLYPYYTVRNSPGGADNDYNTLISVTNTGSSVKAVKVRFLEGQNSREVLDFNLFLSPKDVWTGAIVKNTEGAKLISADHSCLVGARAVDAIGATTGAPFNNAAYAGGAEPWFVGDGGPSELDRTSEGYFEIIEMATFANTGPGSIGYEATHNAAGDPPNKCAGISDALAARQALPPTGGIIGSSVIINVKSGVAIAANPVMLGGFFDVSGGPVNLSRPSSGIGSERGGSNRTDIYEYSRSIYPNLSDVSPKVALTFTSSVAEQNPPVGYGQAVLTTKWPLTNAPFNGVVPVGNPDPVSAVLMRYSVQNEWVVEKSINAYTDWVMTMPTKFFYAYGATAADRLPFENQYGFPLVGLACDEVSVNLWDREEKTITTSIGIFSPPPITPTTAMCHEVNVFTFGREGSDTGLLGSRLGVRKPGTSGATTADYSSLKIPASQLPGTSGWASVTFPNSSFNKHAMKPESAVLQRFDANGNPLPAEAANVVLQGLPVIGFAAQWYQNNSTAGSSLGNYAVGIDHKYKKLFVRR